MKNYVAIYNEAVADYYYEKEQEQKSLAIRLAVKKATSKFYFNVLSYPQKNYMDNMLDICTLFDDYNTEILRLTGKNASVADIHNKRIRKLVAEAVEFVRTLEWEDNNGDW